MTVFKAGMKAYAIRAMTHTFEHNEEITYVRPCYDYEFESHVFVGKDGIEQVLIKGEFKLNK